MLPKEIYSVLKKIHKSQNMVKTYDAHFFHSWFKSAVVKLIKNSTLPHQMMIMIQILT